MRVLFLMLFLATTTVYSQQCPCCDTLHRQFDFWVGTWEVKDSTGKLLGHNTIELIQDSCALRESWTGGSGYTGTSISYYNRNQKHWNQYWVDAYGGSIEMKGGYHGDRMILKTGSQYNSKNKVHVESKVEWIKLDDGRVRQLWRQSIDGGQTWTIAFDGYYKRK